MLMNVSLEVFNPDLWFHISNAETGSNSLQSLPTYFNLCCPLLNVDKAVFVVDLAEK